MTRWETKNHFELARDLLSEVNCILPDTYNLKLVLESDLTKQSDYCGSWYHMLSSTIYLEIESKAI